MATLQGLTGNKPTTAQTSTAISSGNAKLSSDKYVVGEKLADDLLRSMKVNNESANQMLDVGEDIATRIAVDKTTELALFIEEKRSSKSFNPEDPTSLRQLQSDIHGKQLELSKQTFILPNVQHAFDKAYTAPTAISTAKINTALEQEALRIDKELNIMSNLEDLNVEQNNGITPDTTALVTRANSMSAGNPESLHSNWLKVAKTSTLTFNDKVANGLPHLLASGGWDNKTGFTIDVKKQIFENAFNGYGKLNDDGTINFNKEIQGEATREEIRSSWSSFVNAADKSLKSTIGDSTIPESQSSLKLNGSTTYEQSVQMLKLMDEELAQHLAKDANVVNDDKFQKLVENRKKAGVKATLLKQQTDNYNAFADGKMSWENYINTTTSASKQFTHKGQIIKVGAEEGDAVAFAQRQFDIHDDKLRAFQYTSTLPKGLSNPYHAAAQAEINSGGKLKSKYLNGLVSDTNTNSTINGADYKSVKSEYNKAIAFMEAKKSFEGSWTYAANDEIQTVFKTIDDELDAGRIDEKKAFTRAKAHLEGLQNSTKMSEKVFDSVKGKALKKGFDIDADTANEYGWLNIGLGNEEYPTGTQSLMYNVFAKDKMAKQDEAYIKDYVASRVVPLRSSKVGVGKVAGGLALPWRKAIMIFTDGRNIAQDKASDAIAQRLRMGLGQKYSDISDNTVSFRQYRDDSGEVITAVGIRPSLGAPVTKIFTFTMDELEKGAVAQTKVEQK